MPLPGWHCGVPPFDVAHDPGQAAALRLNAVKAVGPLLVMDHELVDWQSAASDWSGRHSKSRKFSKKFGQSLEEIRRNDWLPDHHSSESEVGKAVFSLPGSAEALTLALKCVGSCMRNTSRFTHWRCLPTQTEALKRSLLPGAHVCVTPTADPKLDR